MPSDAQQTLTELINGFDNKHCRCFVDDDITDVSVNHVLDRQRAGLVADSFYIIAVKTPISVTFQIKLTGCTGLDTDLGLGGHPLQEFFNLVHASAIIKEGII